MSIGIKKVTHMCASNRPDTLPSESEVSESNTGVPGTFSTQRMVSYTLVMLLGLTMWTAVSGVFEKVSCLDALVPFSLAGWNRWGLWLAGFYTIIYGRQFVLFTKADRVRMRQRSQSKSFFKRSLLRRSTRSSRKWLYFRRGCLGTLAAVLGTFVVLCVCTFNLDATTPLELVGKWVALMLENEGLAAITFCSFFAVMCIWQLLSDWGSWYRQFRQARSVADEAPEVS